MEFLKKLFTNDNSVVGLCAFVDKEDFQRNLDVIFPDTHYTPPVSLEYKTREHLKNIFCA